MNLPTVSARHGALWVRQGFRAFARQPLAFGGMFAAFMFTVFVSTLLPLVGSLVLLLALPLVTLGFMVATRDALEDRFPLPSAFWRPLRDDARRRMALLQLCLLYALATFAIMWLSDLYDDGALDALMLALSGSDKVTPEVVNQRISDPNLRNGLLLRFGLAGLLSVPFWHAPALVHWHGHSVAKALFASTVAVWRNKAAFTVYGLAWIGVILGFTIVASLLFGLLGQPQWIALAAMPASLLFSTVFYVSLYFTFVDCFAAAPPSAAAAGPTPEELR
ncbi:MAG: BPSS1780 family membrane protein [Burkholderiaceae bacterium]